ncbi:MAG: diguanylate cyclase [Oscillospiraceae bacterium]|nr:diguanylate cyclase [Oscillospiraceae bacterium]
MVRTAFTKANVLKALEADDFFSLNYRILMDGKPTYVHLKATRLRKEDPSHLLFGLSNTDAHMQRLAIYERAMSHQLTFSAVSEALSADYDCILYVNTDTAEFIEYSSSENYKKLGFTSDGQDFFEMCRSDFSRVVYEEDRDIFLRAFEKENLLKALSADRTFLLTFRLVTEGAPYYVRVKVTKMSHVQDHHIVVGLSNIDASMQRVQQYEQMRAIANRDSLTGVKSKHAYTEDESRIDREISHSGTAPFAVAVCDVNGLKRINDNLGHQAGDEYLRRSCKMICEIFSHSPVYRIGGDEFVVLMTGSDYENRTELMKTLHRLSAAHIGSDEAVVSGGMSEYRPGEDCGVRDAFERADGLMYMEKTLLKSEGATVREDESDQPAQDSEEISVINMRKHILIADDLQTNREILGCLLEEDYDILYASDGVETMEMLRKYKDEIALLLLDLYMPEMTGREVMREMQVDEELMSIPVIMLTVDKDAELDSLKIGAMDFISKPYPDINIVKARIAKCIELSENRDLVRHIQRDKLTGLLNFDYFIRYVDRYDQQYRDLPFDVVAIDVNHFRTVNASYGRQFGDSVLRDLGINVRKLARKTGGIGCRKGTDTFYLYLPHQPDYVPLIEKFHKDLFVDADTAEKVRLRFGVYENAEGEPDAEERFSRAKEAADSVLDDPENNCGFYKDVGAAE